MSRHQFKPEELQQLYRYACALLGGEQDAYDLLQSSLEKYLKSAGEHSNPTAYMRRIMRNSHIDQLRHDALVHWDDYDEEHSVSSDLNWNGIEQIAINRDEVQHCIAQMNGIEREIIFLWAIAGYSTAEVAQQLEMPKNTVLSRIHSLRQKIINNSPSSLSALGGQA